MTRRVIETVKRYREKPPFKTSAEMTELCCKQMGTLECNPKIQKDWYGSTVSEIREKFNIPKEDRIKLLRKGKICGELETRFDMSGKNCCDGVAEITLNEENTPSVLPSYDVGYVYINGGRGPYHWKISGTGFYTDAAMTSKEATTKWGVLAVFTDGACGLCRFQVAGACHDLEFYLPAVEGEYVLQWANIDETWEDAVTPPTEQPPLGKLELTPDEYLGRSGTTGGKGDPFYDYLYRAYSSTHKIEQMFSVYPVFTSCAAEATSDCKDNTSLSDCECGRLANAQNCGGYAVDQVQAVFDIAESTGLFIINPNNQWDKWDLGYDNGDDTVVFTGVGWAEDYCYFSDQWNVIPRTWRHTDGNSNWPTDGIGATRIHKWSCP